tara:strand:- start:178 stop:426 length:249 start_codon:yes stop_codon:yes gene_type:complete
MKTFKLHIKRVYDCEFEYEATDAQEIEDMINWDVNDNVTHAMCDDFWTELAYQELEQMNVDTTDYKVYEKGKERPWKRVREF